MKDILIIGGHTLLPLLNRTCYVFRQPQDIDTTDNYDLIIVENEFKKDAGRKNGKEIIFFLRLEKRCIKPILLICTSNNDPIVSGEAFNEVLKDPYVIAIARSKFIEKIQDPKSLLEPFGNIQSKDKRKLLYQDLRNTIYRQRGYVSELRHNLLNKLRKFNDNQMDEVYTLFRASTFEIDRILIQWKVDSKSREKYQTLFAGCYQLNSIKMLENRVERIYRDMEYEVGEVLQTQIDDDQLEFHVLYISNDEESFKSLEKVLKNQKAFYKISCFLSKNKKDASLTLRKRKQITTVLCDYRFWKNKSVSKENGYLILSEIYNEYPELHYAYLTMFNKSQVIIPPELSTLDVFSKSAVLDGHTSEYFRLIRRIIQKESAIRTARYKWTFNASSSDEDAHWTNFYNKYFPKNINRNENIGKRASQIINKILANKPHLGITIPKVGGRLSRVNNKNKEADALFDRLLVRRVIIGLLNSSDLIDKYSYLSRPVEYKKKLSDRKIYFDIIHQIIKGKNQRVETEEINNISRYFAENLRILTRFNYKYENDELRNYITYAEYKWLKTHLQK